jgi:protocatechuate 3,4-dioxygenase beta subunit
MLDNDDELRGYVLTRREALKLLGASGLATLAACGGASALLADTTTMTSTSGTSNNASCVVRPALTEGPYFVDEKLNRSDIRSDLSTGNVRDGALLVLTFNVSRVASNACAALSGAIVDVWHCDAAGVYSDVSDTGFRTVGQKFLRGYQATDSNGAASFTTIFPGWFSGRAVHIHYKIRTDAASSSGYEFTSQLFFDDALIDTIHAQQPYVAKGSRNVRNAADSIYNEGGTQVLIALSKTTTGYAGAFNIALQM